MALPEVALAALAQLRHRASANARRGSGHAAARLPVVAPQGDLRPLRQGDHAERGTHDRATARDADPRSPRRMRHDGCGGLPGKAELLTGTEGASSRPVRKIVVIAER